MVSTKLTDYLKTFSGADLQIGSALFTADGGYAVQMVNKTGAGSIKGTIGCFDTITNSFVLAPVNSAGPVCVVYEAGVADASLCWVVKSGKAKVYLTNSAGATAAGYVRIGVTADTGEAAGYGVWELVPTAPSSTDKHFQEIGNNIEITAAAGLCLCSLHFN